MAFMTPQYETGKFLAITNEEGEVTYVPEDLGMDPADCIEGDVAEVEVVEGVGVRLSASGYMDCTDWVVFDDMMVAREYLVESYEVDPDTGEDLPEED